MSSHLDMLDRPISVDDYVISYNNIYKVIDLLGYTTVRILLVDKSKTTKSKKIACHEVCIVSAEDVLIWKLKRGY